MRLIPPASDRDGNVYVLYGSRDLLENTVYVGHRLGGWSGGCSTHRGDFGIHGFVGRTTSRMWYWAGDGLVAVDGETGGCSQVLASDPSSGTELAFVAVVPWVKDTPSRVTLTAMVQGTTDPTPFLVSIDLDQQRYASLESFHASQAEDVIVLGTGADPETGVGYIAVSYTQADQRVDEVLVVGSDGALDDVIPLQLDEPPQAYMVQGFLQTSDAGLSVGLLTDGNLLMFDDDTGFVSSVDDLAPGGLLRYEGDLWLTGERENRPATVSLGKDGSQGNPQVWRASEDAYDALESGIRVLDERVVPASNAQWDEALSALHRFPLISPHPLDIYALETSGWLVAGPGYRTSVEGYTAVAFAPLGFKSP